MHGRKVSGVGRSFLVGLPALCGLAVSASAQLGSFSSELGGQSSPLPYNLDIAIGQRAPGAAKAALLRASVIRSFARSPMCFKADMTPAQWQEAMDRFQLLPPTLTPPDPNDPFGDRFNTDLYMWDANGNAGVDAGTASRANLTFSFPADGTTWGIAQSGFAPGPNVLGASLAAANQFGNTEKGREYLRQCLATWKRYGGITYTEVADDNSPQDNATTHVSTRGDIRIGAVALGTATPVLAYNCFPAPGGLVGFSLVGGDMCINASYFGNTDAFASTSNNYRFLRNTCTHEHGHGLGFIHQVPCSGTKLMEPQIATGFDAVQTDDRRAAGRNYGDRNSGNQSLATAKDFGNLSTPVLRSIGAREQSLNGYWDSGNNPTGADYFKFALGSAQNVKIIATPRGGLYTTGQQAGGCNGTTTSHNSTALGNLAYELMSADGTVSIGVVDATATGAIESSTFNALPAGSYAVRVWDNNPANDPLGDDPNTIVQLYDFEIQVGTNVYEDPYANAGVNKRIAAGTACQFIGDINSAITETRIAVTLSRFEWDLDGDGAFETGVAPAASQPKPTFTYVSNGVYNVSLRARDNQGKTGIDTIQVTVYGATTTVTGTPVSSGKGVTAPFTITGTNLKNVTSSSMVTLLSGTGVTVTGVPIPNALGTQVTGLSFVIDSGASVGARALQVSNADGTGSSAAFLTVTAPPCPADLNGDEQVDDSDFVMFAAAYDILDCLDGAMPPGCPADLNDDGIVDDTDFVMFAAAYDALLCP